MEISEMLVLKSEGCMEEHPCPGGFVLASGSPLDLIFASEPIEVKILGQGLGSRRVIRQEFVCKSVYVTRKNPKGMTLPHDIFHQEGKKEGAVMSE